MIVYTKTSFSNPDFQKLIVELDHEFVVRYPSIQHVFTPFNLLDQHARVVMAYYQIIPVGCGAFRPVDQRTIEIKRMYTQPSYRNQGIGKNVLHELEQWARVEGFSVSILETGINQPEAIAAYEKSGYHRIPNFPPYEEMKESICMEKYL
jgi:putative acetyltransferase